MNRWKNYIIPAFYHIRHNLSFAIFYVLGTALAFVFIAIVLQLVYSVVGNEPPMVNADRIVQIGSSRDVRGKTVYIPAEEIEGLMKEIQGYESYAVNHSEFVDVFGEHTFVASSVNYVNVDYWNVFQFEFLEGRAFSQEEFENKQPVAVINKSMADILFKGRVPWEKESNAKRLFTQLQGW